MTQVPEEWGWMIPDLDERLAELVAEAVRHLNMDDEGSDGPWNIIGRTSNQDH